VESLRDNIFEICAKKSSPFLFSFVELRRIKSGVRLRPLGTSVDKIAPRTNSQDKITAGSYFVRGRPFDSLDIARDRFAHHLCAQGRQQL